KGGNPNIKIFYDGQDFRLAVSLSHLSEQTGIDKDIAFFSGKPIVLENLNFGKDRLDTNKKFNRMASNFPFAKMVG
ncbi:hypothetical protein JDF658_26070, partial [Carboxydocella sp. JDF658]